MINLNSLTDKDVGRKIIYRSKGGDKVEFGRLKSWNDDFVFGVYNETALRSDWMNYTGAATDPADVEFV